MGSSLPPAHLNTDCYDCGRTLASDAESCPHCGASKDVGLEIALALGDSVARVRFLMLVIAAFTGASAFLIWSHLAPLTTGNVALLAAAPIAAFAAAHVGLWAWAKHNAFYASLVAMVLFVGNQVLTMVVSPMEFASPMGWVVRVIIFMVLFEAVRGGYRARVLRRDADRSRTDPPVVQLRHGIAR